MSHVSPKMMHQDISNWDPSKSKRSSGIFSVLKWFGGKEQSNSSPPNLTHSPSSSCSSIESVFSTDTVASFAFVPPCHYRPFGTALQPEKFILSGPETNTYRARLAQREARRENDKNLTLRSKYNLYKASESEIERGHNSLPLMTKTSLEEQKGMMHRRTASESSKVRKAGAYCHVKGKRKAPQPPGLKGDNTLRRKKRMAPQPPNPDIICNDSLKLDHGILKPAKEQFETNSNYNNPSNINITQNRTSIFIQNTSNSSPNMQTNSQNATEITTQVSPRPWYKRTLSKNSGNQDKHKDQEKRKSGMLFLTNISELDREAMEIINKENLKMKYLKNSGNTQAPAFMRPKNEHSRANSDSWISPKRKSARDLIAKFNAITGVSKSAHSSSNSKENSQSPPIRDSKLEFVIPVVQEEPSSSTEKSPIVKETVPKSPVARTTAVVKPISRSQWNCPKCTLENDYWRIICRVCSTIKPYFDDFTTTSSPTNSEDASKPSYLKEDPEHKDTNSDFFGLANTEFRISELQRSVFQSQYPKLSALNTNYNKSSESKDKDQNVIVETTNIFQPSYPKINLNYEFKSSDKTSDNKCDTKNIPQLKDNNIEITKKTTKYIKDDEKNVEKIILGDEISYNEPKTKIDNKQEQKKHETKTKVEEKMILGDEISVDKPEYVNINKYEPITIDKNSDEKIKKNDKIEKMILGDEISVKKPDSKITETGTKIKTKQLTDDEKQNSAKREEREKLKKMLIEMKNSLPKRQTNKQQNNETKHRVSLIQEQTEPEIEQDDSPPSPQPETNEKTAELIIATTETIYENIKVKKTDDNNKPIKVSSAVQTNAVFRRNMTPSEKETIENSPSGFQLIGAKDFVGISNEKTGKNDDTNSSSHTYANLNVPTDKPLETNSSKLQEAFPGCSKTDTLEINRLLRRLETSIANGELGEAAVFARELAQLKVPLSVIRQKSDDLDMKIKENGQSFNVDMYVEDKISHRGPFPLQVTENMTLAELKTIVDEKYKIPKGVQRWILGKQLATDDMATLGSLNIKTSGCPIFLYLVAPANDIKVETEIVIEQQPEQNKTIETKTDQLVQITEIDDTEMPSTSWPINKVYNVPIAIIEEDIEDQTDEEIEAPKNENIQDLWKCRACTLLNSFSTNECEVCGLIKNECIDETNDKSEVKNNQTYLQLMNLDNEDLVKNAEGFECLVCLVECLPGEGVTLRECLHQFCRACLANTVEFSEEAEVKCPYRDENYSCDIALQDREVKALVTPLIYEQHLAKSVKQAENKMDNTFHCKTPDCKGWCIYEDNVNEFYCPVCRKNNCLTCQAIHAGRNCKQYQEQMKSQSETDEDARRTRDFLEDMIKRGEALGCPTCQVVLLKKWGCDWVRCSMCKTEICWVTRGPRWGPGGKGDTTGGCKCGVNGIKCHPKCNYCH